LQRGWGWDLRKTSILWRRYGPYFLEPILRNQGGNIGIDKIDVSYDSLYLVHFHLLLLVIREFLLQFKKDW